MAPSQLKQLKTSLKERGLLGVKPSKRAKLQSLQRTASVNSGNANPTNPYELKFAKSKHEVLNRKVKGVDGKPGAARKRANENRTRDLLPELNSKQSTSTFTDKRIGETDKNLTIEEKMFERFVQEQKRKSKGSVFNLEDDTLTHMGQSLSTIDDFSASDSDTSSHGGIQFSTVRHDHFGNFNDAPHPDSEYTAQNTHANGEKKTKAEVMKEVIAKSKHFKEVRRVQREEDYEGGEALDEEFEEMRELLIQSGQTHPERRDRETREKGDGQREERRGGDEQGKEGKEYDIFVRELASEKRAAPTDRLKTDQEQALEAKTTLERQERERLQRMNGSGRDVGASDRQAQGDDLNEFEYADGDKRVIVEYTKSGELVAVRGDEVVVNEFGEMEESESEEEESGSGGELESGEESESDDEMEGIETALLDDEMAFESGSDINSSSDTELTEPVSLTLPTIPSTLETITAPILAPVKELPFIFTAPQTLKDLHAYTSNTTPAELDTILTRIRVLHSVNLGGDNKQKLLLLLELLYQEYDLCTSSESEREKDEEMKRDKVAIDGERVSVLQLHLFSLSLQFPSRATSHALTRLASLQLTFKTTPAFCSVKDLFYLNLITVIFSVSDLRHSVVVPAVTYMCMMISLVGVKSEMDIAKGLLVCREVMRCGKEAGRWAAEVYNFLYRVVRVLQQQPTTSTTVASDEKNEKSTCAYPIHPQDKKMYAKGDFTAAPLSLTTLLSSIPTSESRPALLIATYKLLFTYATTMKDSPSFIEQYSPLQKFIQHSSTSHSSTLQSLHTVLFDQIKVLQGQMKRSELLRRPLILQKRKPVPIASYLPKFDEKFSLDRKSSDPDADRAAKAKLSYEHKREFKGAVRELKRDADFIATEKLRVIKEKDGEYQKKIKGIMGQLATQEGAMRGYEREKKRGKR